MSSRQPSLSIVEYFAEHSGYRCGYCGQEDTNYSHGMWGHTLTTEDYQVGPVSSHLSSLTFLLIVPLTLGLDRPRMAALWTVLLQAHHGQDLLSSVHHQVRGVTVQTN